MIASAAAPAMSGVATATGQLTLAISRTGGGEALAFWVLAPIAVVAALLMVFARSAVHAALLLALDMLCLAALYAAQDAPFLAFVQVIVYTGAIMMLFLFVLMLVGVDAADSLVETLRGQRAAAALFGIGFLALLVAGIGHAVSTMTNVGLKTANAEGNLQGIARLLFTRYVFAFEATSALLITAALAAMVLAHKERIVPRLSQRELAHRRFRGGDPAPLPGPGVYADHDAVDTPALLPDGGVAPGSVSPVLTQMHTTRHAERATSRAEQVRQVEAVRDAAGPDARPGAGHSADSAGRQR